MSDIVDWMPEARQITAQCWCDEKTSNRVLDVDLAEAFATRIAELMHNLETERLRLAACGTAALGYFDSCLDEYKSASLDDVLKLRQQLADTQRLLAESQAREKDLREGVAGLMDHQYTGSSEAMFYLQNLIDAADEVVASPTGLKGEQ